MKQIILIPAVLGLASALLFSSCGKEQCPTAVSEGSRMKIEVSTASEKTILVDGLQPYLDKNDVVFVGGVNGEGVYTKHEFSPESQDYADPSSQTSWPATSASFISKDVWPSGVTPVYATCNYASTSVSFTDGKIKTMVGTGPTGGTQKISKSGSYATRAACHVGKFDNEGRLQTLKNVNALLGFKLSSSGVSSVKIESVGGETISGYVVVDYEKLAAGNADFFTVPSDNKNTVITVTSSLEENVFPVGEIIYVSLIPHTYAGGLKFTMTKTDGTSAEKIISSSLTFKPGKVRNITQAVDNGLTYEKTDIVLDFTTIGSSTFKYSNEGSISNLLSRSSSAAPWTENVDFWAAAYPNYIFHGTVRYWSTSGGCLNQKQNTYVKLPKISGYKLSAIEGFTVVHAASRNYTITINTETISDANTVGKTTSLGTGAGLVANTSWTLTDTYSANTDYYIFSENEGGYKFKLIYKPVKQ